MFEEKKLRVEFHCHTVYSFDSSNHLQQLLQVAKKRDIQRLAITDHNTIEGALEAKKMDPELIIVGEEIVTTKGEMIGYFLQEEVPAYLSLQQTIEMLRTQNAFISIPHPLDQMRRGWNIPDLLEILPQIDAIEVFNARCLHDSINQRTQAFADEHNLAGIVGSDAHSLDELGLATMLLPHFEDADGLREVIRQGIAETHLLSAVDHFKASASIALEKFKPGKISKRHK